MGFLNDFVECAPIYSALFDSSDEMWYGDDNLFKEIRDHIDVLTLLNVSQPAPMLLSARRTLNNVKFEKLLKFCVGLHVRYNVCERNANDLTKVYNKAALALANKVKIGASDFEDVYPSDDSFVSGFTSKEFKGTKSQRVAKYILVNIEQHYTGQALDYTSPKITIEHIYSKNPITKENKLNDKKYVIGNFTLLNKRDNNDKAKNMGFTEKRPIYKTSQYYITKQLSDYSNWHLSDLKKWGSYLGNAACGIWKMELAK